MQKPEYQNLNKNFKYVVSDLVKIGCSLCCKFHWQSVSSQSLGYVTDKMFTQINTQNYLLNVTEQKDPGLVKTIREIIL